MKKHKAVALVSILILTLIFSLVPVSGIAYADEPTAVKTYEIGSPVAKDVTATLYSDGTLYIEESGNTADYSNGEPWFNAHNDYSIKKVIFGSGVKSTSLDHYFDRCAALTEIQNIPSTAVTMRFTFKDCASLKTSPVLPSGVNNLYGTFITAAH